MKKIINRRAKFDYHLQEKLEAGIVLTGAEVKSIKAGRISLKEGFIRLKKGEAWLFNVYINPYPFADNRHYDPRRTRKLLLHQNQLRELSRKVKEKGLTIVPVSCYTKGRNVKLMIALGKGKKKYEKRAKIKAREFKRKQEKILKS
jgi:SsrA-binding protein